ncbi:MAG: hypothetical protein F4069_10410 [Rhodothermaceae bacterium]|nr:hypothetical protein [Bacteroidota bacterium]MXW15154.1 hypothetical protein [Rhodothermaceae bacterium]MXZ18025.1 hypothetical protein [Rhodothermaceae bacterium]MYC03092.1 hypothetical protein [Rhodothermaceae bacterium]MYG69330.1 hypothetical protein [Rhodothermaceae bacterium]
MDFISLPRIPLSIRCGYAGVLFLFLSFTACQSGEGRLTRFEDSPVIDRLLASAPHFVANTDIEAERWVATTRLGLPTDSLILGRPSNLIAIGDSVYVSENLSTHIFAVGADGYLSRKIGVPGKGPGEFTYLGGLQYNGSHVFTKDEGRVQVFTEKFEYVNSFPNSSRTLRRFSVSPDYIFSKCLGDNWLICARSTSPPYDWIPSIELLPVLALPDRSGENFNEVTVSPEGDRIAMAYTGLPYIFVYDDQFRHLRTIRFEGRDVRNFNPVVSPPDGVPAGSMESGTRGFIATIKFINSRYLVVRVVPRTNYIFDLSENDYELTRKIIFRPLNDAEERKDVPAADFLLHKDHLYVSSPWEEYVYGYKFDLE